MAIFGGRMVNRAITVLDQTVDHGDIEIRILVGCTAELNQLIFQFNVGSEPRWRPGIPHIHKFRLIHILTEVKEGFGNRINLCRDRGLSPGSQHRIQWSWARSMALPDLSVEVAGLKPVRLRLTPDPQHYNSSGHIISLRVRPLGQSPTVYPAQRSVLIVFINGSQTGVRGHLSGASFMNSHDLVTYSFSLNDISQACNAVAEHIAFKMDKWLTKTIQAVKRGRHESEAISGEGRVVKPHTDGKSYLSPAAKYMVSIVIGEKPANMLDVMSFSSDTLSRRILSLANELEEKLITELKSTKYLVVQPDESTVCTNMAQLLTF
ncbi:unnamed protein product, partial [Timema podura]|nr:unnamed protein product [Timema podura]